MTRSSVFSILGLAVPTMLAAQAAAPSTAAVPAPTAAVRRAAESITVDYLRNGVFTIAHDSMRGRNTPSRGLDLTAEYIAAEFSKFGLKPGGDNGGWQQRYPLFSRRLLTQESSIRFEQTGGMELRFSLASSAALRFGVPTQGPLRGSVTILAGPVDTAAINRADFRDQVIVWLAAMPGGNPPPGFRDILASAARTGAVGLVMISNRTSGEGFERLVASQGRPSVSREATPRATGGVAAYEIPEEVVMAASPDAGLQLQMMRQSPTMLIQPLPEWLATIDVKMVQDEPTSAPNTVGILEGSDPVLKNEYIVFSAHMDHVGDGGTGEDPIFNGADDDASGTIGVVALARAFSQNGARPRRSVIFLTVSGEEKGLWGSDYFAANPPVPLEKIVANINLDMIGRNSIDSIVVIGKEHSDLGATLNAIHAAHPELKMVPSDDIWPQERFYFRSDHYNFARRGVPILFFFNGTHEDYHRVGDSPDKIGYEKMSRIVKMAFYLGQAVGNRAERPRWNPESYRQIVQPAVP